MLYLSCPVRELLKNVLKSHILTKQMWLNLLTYNFTSETSPKYAFKVSIKFREKWGRQKELKWMMKAAILK